MAPSLLYRETATAFAAATGAATGVACALNYAIKNYRIGEVRTISAILRRKYIQAIAARKPRFVRLQKNVGHARQSCALAFRVSPATYCSKQRLNGSRKLSGRPPSAHTQALQRGSYICPIRSPIIPTCRDTCTQETIIQMVSSEQRKER